MTLARELARGPGTQANDIVQLDASAKLPAVDGSSLTNLVSSVNGKTGAVQSIVIAATSVASTSGTAIDFTGIPSWAKRITVMLNGVSTSGTSGLLVQIGPGSITTTGYTSNAGYSYSGGGGGLTSSIGFVIFSNNATTVSYVAMTITNYSGNNWLSSHSGGNATGGLSGGGSIALGGVLDRVRITTVNGTDTFDAGSINIMWE